MKKLVNPYLQEFQDEGAIDLIKKYSPIVEMGAGGGYWASLIQQSGGDVICYDITHKSKYFEKTWFEVQIGKPSSLINHADRTLFLCWPPYDETMAQNCLTYFEGQHVIYIGESEGGCTANDSFFKKLDNQFTLVETYNHPTWKFVHDAMYVYRRK